jgi:outer membrane protein TolC
LLRVQEAQAAYDIQSAARLPTIGLGSSHGRARVPADLNASGRSVVAGDQQVFVGLNSWELDLWGRVKSLSDAALGNYLALDATQHAVQSSLVKQVALNYLALRSLDERLALTQRTIASREESLRIFKRRTEVGSTSLCAHAGTDSGSPGQGHRHPAGTAARAAGQCAAAAHRSGCRPLAKAAPPP